MMMVEISTICIHVGLHETTIMKGIDVVSEQTRPTGLYMI